MWFTYTQIIYLKLKRVSSYLGARSTKFNHDFISCPRSNLLSGSVDDVYGFSHQDSGIPAGGAGGGGGLSSRSPPPPPGGVPVYVHGSDSYNIPIQHTYALNGESYGQSVVGHVPAHGLGQMQGPQSAGLEGLGSGDDQLLSAHMSGMSSPSHPSVPAPQHVYMPAPGTYMVPGGNGAGSNGSASGGGAGGGGSSGGSGGGGGHVQHGAGGLQQPMVLFGHQPQANGPPPSAQQHQPPQQQQLQSSHPAAGSGAESGAHASASPMYLPITQAGYQYVPPHLSHLQSASGVPIYQMAPGLDGSQAAGRPNGVVAASPAGAPASTGSASGRGSTGTPQLASPSSGAPPAQSFQVHYALTPQGIVPMVPIMPNGAGGFTNPALYPGIGGVFDDGRGSIGTIAGITGGVDGVDKGRMSPPLAGGGAAIPARFAGSPHPHATSQHLHAGIPGAIQPMHAPAWSVAGVHEAGPYHDGGRFNDRGYPGGAPEGFRGGPGGRDARMAPRDAEAGKDVKDRRKRYDVFFR